MRPLLTRLFAVVALLLGVAVASAAPATNALPTLASSGSSAAVSVFRVMGALCLVFALFFGAAWLYRNWARLNAGRSGHRKLQLLEARSLGGRQSVLVIAYEKQRFLVGATPQGLTLLSHLPEAGDAVEPPSPSIVPLPFTGALMQAIGRK